MSTDTSSKKEHSAETALRLSFQNQMSLCTYSMLEPSTKRNDVLVVTVPWPWEEWHSHQNTTLRSTASLLPWLQGQLKGEFMQTYNKVWQCLLREPKLDELQFKLPPMTSAFPLSEDPVEIEFEDEMATTTAHLAFGVNFNRLRRSLHWLLGWCARAALFLDPGVAPAELNIFRKDGENSAHYEARAQHVSGLNDIVQRDVFNHVAVQQVREIIKANGYKMPVGDARDWFSQAFDKLAASQAR